ncbi:MAG: Gfo/Idh/MocA family oxidoreductase [Clostridiales bacterium]|nr:Gfo/Idh/MocA family oxidoreductase [Clostridiales bacterium]MDD7366986.1 Gfo/Idh/MocA family oxidoreductase [Clostridiales bacterium]
MDKLKVAVIGNGGISGVHLRGYSLNPDVEIYALCDINEERLNRRGDEYHVDPARRFTDVNEMLAACPEIEAVSVCTWNAAHAQCAIAALNAGKHVLCEKPMAMTVEEAEAMQAAAEKNNRLLMIGFVRRFGNDCAIMKDFIDNGYFGDIYYAKATYLRRKGCPGGWFGDKARSGGGPLIDLGVHIIDLCRYLMGNPKPVSVYGATFNKLGNRSNIKSKAGYISQTRENEDIFNVEDLATAMIRFDNGSVLQIEASFSLNIEKDEGVLQFFGTKAGAKLDPELTIYSEMNDYMTNVKLANSTALSFDGLFENEINHFVECVRTGKPCRNPAQDGVTLMKILTGIYKSAETGHEVLIND